MSPFPVCPKLFCSFDVSRLAGLVSAAKQYDYCVSVPSAVDSVPSPHVDTKLKDSFAYRFPIAERSILNLTNPPRNARLRHLIAESLEPLIEWALACGLLINDQLEHETSVA
jgi:hypothetical protein